MLLEPALDFELELEPGQAVLVAPGVQTVAPWLDFAFASAAATAAGSGVVVLAAVVYSVLGSDLVSAVVGDRQAVVVGWAGGRAMPVPGDSRWQREGGEELEGVER